MRVNATVALNSVHLDALDYYCAVLMKMPTVVQLTF